MPRFVRYLGVDYSGAREATTPLSGLRVFIAEQGAEPKELRSPRPRRQNWDRETLARWLTGQLASGPPAALGIDHCFSTHAGMPLAPGSRPAGPPRRVLRAAAHCRRTDDGAARGLDPGSRLMLESPSPIPAHAAIEESP